MSSNVSTSSPHPFTNRVIRASAGTGKTFQLSNRFLQLLDRGVSLDQILATTFTRKAAGEILDRIVQRLVSAAMDSGERDALASFLGNPAVTQDRCRDLLCQMLQNLHRLRVGTLDSLFVRMAQALSLEIGLAPDWRILDDMQEDQLRQAAIAEVFRQESTAEILRLSHLLAKGEIRRGVAELISNTVQDLHELFQESDSSAWHAIPHYRSLSADELAALIDKLRHVELPNHRMTQARDSDCDRALAGDWDALIDKGLSAKVLVDVHEYFKVPIPDAAIRLYRELLDNVRAVVVTQTALQTEGSYQLLLKYDLARRRLQGLRGGLQFSEVTHRLDAHLGSTVSATTRAADQIPHRLDGQIRHLLLDEFQDTSPFQWRVLRPFVDQSSKSDGNSSFFCVGDVKQAIYGWRGGVAEIFDAIDDHVPNLTQEHLSTSYRSSPAIIAAVNQVFAGIGNHSVFAEASSALESWRTRFQIHSTTKTELPGYACLRTAPQAAADENSEDVVLQYATDLIVELTTSAPRLEIGVLVRRNKTVAALIHSLRARGILASEEGGNPLTDSAAVQLLMSALRLADHPGDTVARFHIARSPLAHFAGLPSHHDDSAARRLSGRLRDELLRDGYGRAVGRWATALAEQVGARDQSRLRQLVEMAYSYQARATLRADDFVRQVERTRVPDPLAAAVRVMTIFQAKGLEFEVVVLPELEGLLTGRPPQFVVERPQPTAPVTRVCRYVRGPARPLFSAEVQGMFAGHTNQKVMESLCLLYVALTRAVHALYIVVAPKEQKNKAYPNSLAGLLRAALAKGQPVVPDSLLFEVGDPRWLSAMPQDKAESRLPAKPSLAEIPAIVRLAPSARRQRGLSRRSPSGLEGGHLRRLNQSVEPGGGLATLRGTVVHAWFEQIQWLEDGLPNLAGLRDRAVDLVRAANTSAPIEDWLEEFQRMIRQPEIADCLRRTAYSASGPMALRVETERSFAIAESEGLLTGSIDRLVLMSENDRISAADIIDFKTDQIRGQETADVQAKVAHYQPQMDAYRRAVAAITSLPLDRITGRLLFTTVGRVASVF